MNNEEILIFLSRPNPFLDSQQYFIDKLQKYLNKYSIKSVTLQADNYDLTDSLNYLKGIIKHCYGMIIISFKQIFIEEGSKKKGGIANPQFFYPNEIDISGQALTSPFCQIEGTIGLLNELPLLIINEDGVREEGIISGGKFCTKTPNFNLSDIDDFFNNQIVQQKISIWAEKVINYYLFLSMKKV